MMLEIYTVKAKNEKEKTLHGIPEAEVAVFFLIF